MNRGLDIPMDVVNTAIQLDKPSLEGTAVN